jgi:hypothetical protein
MGHRWKAPLGGLMKVNWDVVVDMHNMGIGVIDRDLIGEVLATLQSLKDDIVDSVIAKSFATLQSVLFAKEMGWQKVEFEDDTLQVVLSRYSQLIDDV